MCTIIETVKFREASMNKALQRFCARCAMLLLTPFFVFTIITMALPNQEGLVGSPVSEFNIVANSALVWYSRR